MSIFSERRRALIGNGEYFPPDPGNYPTLEQSFSANGTFTAPKDGWYEIRLYGSVATGGGRSFDGTVGGTFDDEEYYNTVTEAVSGGGSGGGGFSQSRVKLYEGDTIVFARDGSAGTWTATINSSAKENYDVMIVTASKGQSGGAGGAGGKASGGNYSNINGGAGFPGTSLIPDDPGYIRPGDYEVGTVLSAPGGAGGQAATSGSRGGKKGYGLTLTVQYVNTINKIKGFFIDRIAGQTYQSGYARVYSGEYGG